MAFEINDQLFFAINSIAITEIIIKTEKSIKLNIKFI